MYGVPSENKLNCFIGKELIQICFGSTHIIFRFTGSVEISIEVAVKHILSDGRIHITDESWKQETWLTLLLGSTVNSVNSIEGKILRLGFSHGHIIEIADESAEYESFQIKTDEGLIIV